MKTSEEILKVKFNNNFLDIEYIDIIIEAMEEHAKQKAIAFAKHIGARELQYAIETGEWNNGFCGDTTEQEYENFMIEGGENGKGS